MVYTTRHMALSLALTVALMCTTAAHGMGWRTNAVPYPRRRRRHKVKAVSSATKDSRNTGERQGPQPRRQCRNKVKAVGWRTRF